MTSRATCLHKAGVALTVAGLAFASLPTRAQTRDRRPALARLTAPSAADTAWSMQSGQAREGRDSRDRRVERVDRSTRTLALGPTGSLELKNISGDISVTGGTGRDVTIEIVRRSRARTDSDAAMGLQQVQVAVDHRGERASVGVVYPRERTPYQVSASFVVAVPSGTRVTARSVSGHVVVAGVAGDVAVETVSGNVDVTNGRQVSKARSVSGSVALSNIEGARALTAGSVSGSVELRHVRASRLSVEVMSGDIRTDDVSCESAQMKSLSGSVEYAGRLSEGGRYEFNSHSGSVRVVALGPVGFELQATTFSGRIRPEGLSLQAMSTHRGSLRATIGDGSAVVVAQTFSGDVVIARR